MSDENAQAMNALKVEVVLKEDGTLTLQDLPFYAGDAVEVIILGLSVTIGSQRPQEKTILPLKGSVIRYDDPFEPAVTQDNWEAWIRGNDYL
jgi:hypothetical protein